MSIDWQKINKNSPLLAIASPLTERDYLLKEVSRQFDSIESLYFWNLGYQYLQQVNIDRDEVFFTPTELEPTEKPIGFCSMLDKSGIYIIEGIRDLDEDSIFQLENAYFHLQRHQERKIILVSDRLKIPTCLYPIIPQFKNCLPTLEEIAEIGVLPGNKIPALKPHR